MDSSANGNVNVNAASGVAVSSKLRIYNSLTRRIEDFVPNDPKGRLVKWYSCGPTVYDASHMGHARSYISFDILRRVLTNYFGYDVQYVMNVTDIDDKIIKKGRHEHLFNLYKEKTKDVTKVLNDVMLARESYNKDTLETTDPEKKTMKERILSKVDEAIRKLGVDLQSSTIENIDELKENFLEGTKDVICEHLDFNFLQKKEDKHIDNEVFAQFARKWESDFFSDMNALNVLNPDVLTRVSEYVQEIVDFILIVIKNKYAYESNGSVYFDVQHFKNSPSHKYAKLVPEAVGDAKALAEGEGELTQSGIGEKKSSADFALWKASKLGEPSWNSPWGQGRPGWHIECSAMASAIFGPNLDIHTGGVDLKFPHHDNEIAQSEAYFENDDWVKYFLHSGHLTIAGCKMSKSLKNFITIKQALEEYSSSQLRMTFLIHSWKDTLDYSPSGMQVAVQLEKSIQEFFLNVKDCTRSLSQYPKWTEEDLELQNKLNFAKNSVHEALCDNIDTRTTMFAIKDLMGHSNIYIQNSKAKKHSANGQLLKSIARYITNILRTLGVIPSYEAESIGFKTGGGDIDNPAVEIEDIILPYMDVLSEFRQSIRNTSKSIQDSAIKSAILKECDLIRDEKLPLLGVRLEDHEGCPTVVKYVGKEAMLKEKEQRERQERERDEEKQKAKAELARIQAEKEAQRKIPPWDYFKIGEFVDKYSQFDVKGIPTHDKEGEPLLKSQTKKLLKLFTAQEKKYNEYLKSISSGNQEENNED